MSYSLKFRMGIALIVMAISTLFLSSISIGQEKEISADFLATYTLKLASYEKGICDLKDASIYVLGDSDLADIFIDKRGEKIGNASLASVMKSDAIPPFKVTILFIAKDTDVEKVLKFARKNKVLTITSIPELVSNGVILSIGADDDGKARVLLNTKESDAQGFEWEPEIMKIAEVVE